MLGMGVMLHALSGGSKENASTYYGRKIVVAELKNDEIHITFEDGTKIRIMDAGQSCCEDRYIQTDDDPKDLVGHPLEAIEVKDAPDIEDEQGACHEVAFLEIRAGHETVTFSTHNEHNGYYGGFALTLEPIDA